MTDLDDDIDDVIRYLGLEVREKREQIGYSRTQASDHLKTIGVSAGDRTLLAYEHGLRELTVRRLIELCIAYGASPVLALASAIHRADAAHCRECGR